MAEGCSSSAEFLLELLEEEEVGRMEPFQLVGLLEEVVQEEEEEGRKGQDQEELKQQTSQEVLLERWRSGKRNRVT